MNFDQSFTLNRMMNDAKAQFGEIDLRLNGIETRLDSKLNGKTRSSLIGAFFVSLLFLVAYFALFFALRNNTYSELGAISLLLSGLLVIFMVVDEFAQLNYFGTFLKYKDNLSQLKRRIELGRNSLEANLDTFKGSRSSKWSHSLSVGDSIYDDAKRIENSLVGMESLADGFLHGVKNVLFYTVGLAWTVFGSLALLGYAYDVIGDIDQGWLIAAVVVACVGEVLLSKLVWSKTNCEVNNTTLLMTLTGPVLFIAVIAVAALVVGVAMLVAYIIGICIAIGVVIASISGG